MKIEIHKSSKSQKIEFIWILFYIGYLIFKIIVFPILFIFKIIKDAFILIKRGPLAIITFFASFFFIIAAFGVSAALVVTTTHKPYYYTSYVTLQPSTPTNTTLILPNVKNNFYNHKNLFDKQIKNDYNYLVIEYKFK